MLGIHRLDGLTQRTRDVTILNAETSRNSLRFISGTDRQIFSEMAEKFVGAYRVTRQRRATAQYLQCDCARARAGHYGQFDGAFRRNRRLDLETPFRSAGRRDRMRDESRHSERRAYLS